MEEEITSLFMSKWKPPLVRSTLDILEPSSQSCIFRIETVNPLLHFIVLLAKMQNFAPYLEAVTEVQSRWRLRPFLWSCPHLSLLKVQECSIVSPLVDRVSRIKDRLSMQISFVGFHDLEYAGLAASGSFWAARQAAFP